MRASISVFYPTDCFIKSPDLVLRRFPEWRQCYAYTPARPELHELNATAWLILELCEGQSLLDLESAFVEIVRRKVGDNTAKTLLHNGLRDLLDRGILVYDADSFEERETDHDR